MATYKKWTTQEKLSAVLDGLKGRSVQEVCAGDCIAVSPAGGPYRIYFLQA